MIASVVAESSNFLTRLMEIETSVVIVVLNHVIDLLRKRGGANNSLPLASRMVLTCTQRALPERAGWHALGPQP